ncbi:MAG: YihY/virulence factor BrkB family protein [Deltaproteobacteria bacterium]|nr:YihY/virulence factor BrkB family protein [Deltaproteobacteria bacterium]
MHTITRTVLRFIGFIKGDIWRIRLKDLPRKQSFLIKQLRVFLLSIRGFAEDKCQLRASALTFYSLISIVPVAAMAFGIAKGFGFEKRLEQQLLEQFQGQEEIIAQVITFAQSLLSNTKGGLIAGVGIVVLFWAVIKVLGNIEDSFNDIWGIRETRSLGRKFSDYLSVMLLGPILMILSSSVTVFITTQVTLIMEKIALLGIFSPLISFVLKALPYGIIWVLFTFLYVFMPNTKVNFRSGLLAGIIAGTIYQIVQFGYITFQVGAARYNAIYGSFAALPLFLIWLQLSWLIVLFGAEFSFAHQNVDTYEFEPDSLQISNSFKRLLSLQITHLLVSNFAEGEKPLTAMQMSHRLEIPIRLVHQILYELGACGIVSDTKTDEYKEPAYQPARDIGTLTIQFVVNALEDRGTDAIPVAQTAEVQALSDILRVFRDEVAQSPSNRLLKDI